VSEDFPEQENDGDQCTHPLGDRVEGVPQANYPIPEELEKFEETIWDLLEIIHLGEARLSIVGEDG
jgi:hypothetical protein